MVKEALQRMSTKDAFFGGQPHALPHSSFYSFPSFAFPFAGAVDKIVLPVVMQSVSFEGCDRLTGTAENMG